MINFKQKITVEIFTLLNYFFALFCCVAIRIKIKFDTLVLFKKIYLLSVSQKALLQTHQLFPSDTKDHYNSLIPIMVSYKILLIRMLIREK
ncbi:hypothetical protein BpHYR1_017701 [Brachionus plicatilis]|uniref:Uncharacterized protein n=1 Tax=Brachionus plicatilis TaxID=10195 RepID=A0A3M7S8P0_BRAPC|nr:hypothetical protein BpHYR1_017701 [Brachionus plicatilis]